MTYAMFRCCVTANHVPEFDGATDALLSRLGVDVGEIRAFGCCGYPLKNLDLTASLVASARNLALAERAGRTILTACACCYGTLTLAARQLQDPVRRAEINRDLVAEGLTYQGTATVKHLFHVLRDEVGIERIARETKTSPAYQQVVLQYGCKLLRPNRGADSASIEATPFFEQMVSAAGSGVIPWGLEKDCCGSGICSTDQELSRNIRQAKMDAARAKAADGLVAACPYCLLQLRRARADDNDVAVISVAELLCLALGIESGGAGASPKKVATGR